MRTHRRDHLRGGLVVELCTPGVPAASDLTCDGIDDDCDGDVDDDTPRAPSFCSRGACEAAGEFLCVDGGWVDTCMPGVPVKLSDASCDGVDDDCDGLVDEDCVPEAPDARDVDAGDGPADALISDAESSAPPDLDPPAPRPDRVADDLPPLPDAAFDPFPEAGLTIEAPSPKPRVECGCRASGQGPAEPLFGLLALAFAGRPRRRRRGAGCAPRSEPRSLTHDSGPSTPRQADTRPRR